MTITLAEFRELQEVGLIHSAPCGSCGRIDEICEQCLVDIRRQARRRRRRERVSKNLA